MLNQGKRAYFSCREYALVIIQFGKFEVPVLDGPIEEVVWVIPVRNCMREFLELFWGLMSPSSLI